MNEPAIRLGVYCCNRLLAVILCDDCDQLIEWRNLLAPCGLFERGVRGNARLPLFLEMES